MTNPAPTPHPSTAPSAPAQGGSSTQGPQHAPITLLGPLPPLPTLRTALDASAILSKLDALARRGKLAGFEPAPAGAGHAFSLEAPGAPFDHSLRVSAATRDGQTTLTARLVMLPRLPAIFAVLLVFSIWPGVWLTHSMLRAYFSFYTYPEWVTWAWYIPLTVLPLPWALAKMVRRSREAAYASALESAEILATTLGARIDQPGTK